MAAGSIRDAGDIAARRQLSDSDLSITATENGTHPVDRLSRQVVDAHADLPSRLTADSQFASGIACRQTTHIHSQEVMHAIRSRLLHIHLITGGDVGLGDGGACHAIDVATGIGIATDRLDGFVEAVGERVGPRLVGSGEDSTLSHQMMR